MTRQGHQAEKFLQPPLGVSKKLRMFSGAYNTAEFMSHLCFHLMKYWEWNLRGYEADLWSKLVFI